MLLSPQLDMFHVTGLDFTLCVVRYESGDHVAVFPTNDAALVNKLGQVLGVDLDVVISLNNLDGNTLNLPKDLALMCCHMSEVAELRHFLGILLSLYHARFSKSCLRYVINLLNEVLMLV